MAVDLEYHRYHKEKGTKNEKENQSKRNGAHLAVRASGVDTADRILDLPNSEVRFYQPYRLGLYVAHL